MPVEDDDDRPRRRGRDDDDRGDRPRRGRDDDRDRPRGRRGDDDDRSRRRRDDGRDDYHDDGRHRRPARQTNVCGIIAMIFGIMALVVGIMPCVGTFAVFTAVPAVVLGLIGIILGAKSDGRMGKGMAIAGLTTGIIAVLLAGFWYFVLDRTFKAIDTSVKEAQERREKEAAVELEEIKKSTEPVRTTVQEINKAYEQDRAAADAKYKRKIVEVTGRVVKIDRHEFAKPAETVVELSGPQGTRVMCEFVGEDEQLKALVAGQEVTIRGRCTGHIAWVELKPCLVIAKGAKADPAGAGNAQGRGKGPAGDVEEENAAAFYSAWKANKAAFDRDFKGKVIEVYGIIRDVNLTGDQYTVSFEAGGPGELVKCVFDQDPATRDRLAQLKPGAAKNVRVRGKCPGGSPTLEGCVLVP